MIEPQRYEQRAQLRPQDPVQAAPAVSGIGEAADGLLKVGTFMFDVRDEINTGDAMAADVNFGKRMNDILYNPDNGYMYSEGSDAVHRRGEIEKLIATEKDRYLSGLSPDARALAQQSFDVRAAGLNTDINRHAVGQSKAYLESQTKATIGLYAEQAILRPDEAAKSIGVIEGQLRAQAEREGWPPERLTLELQGAGSTVHRGIAERLATVSPSQAMDYVSANRDKFSGSDLAAMESALMPAAKAEKGRSAAAAVASGTGYVYSTQVDYAMGPKRPYKPDQPVIDVIGLATEQQFGKGTRVVITSGQEGDKAQHGAARHKTGNAADIQIIRPDGTVVKATDADAASFAVTAARLGARGIGYGAEYMGGDHFHIDLVGTDAGGSNTWATGARAANEQIMGAIGEFAGFKGGSVRDLLAIEDPEVRAAALSEYNLISGIAAKEHDAMMDEAVNAGFQIIESGGSIESLSPEFRNALGIGGMSKLREYASKVINGESVRTDAATYLDLRSMAETSPEEFARLNLLDYADKLSMGDLKKMADLKGAIQSGAREQTVNDAKLSNVRSELKPYLEAAGIDLGKQGGAARGLAAEEMYVRWYDGYVAREKKAPSTAERQAFMRSSVSTTVNIDPPGLGNEIGGNHFDIKYNGSRVRQGDAVVNSGGVTLADLGKANTAITINGIEVPHIEVMNAIEAFRQSMGFDPETREVISMLISTGEYAQ